MLRRHTTVNYYVTSVCFVRQSCARRLYGFVGQPTLVWRAPGGQPGKIQSFPACYIIPHFNEKTHDTSRTSALVAFFKQYKVDQRYVNEVAQTKSFKEAAQRGLVLGAAVIRNQVSVLEHSLDVDHKSSILAERFERVAHLPDNPVHVNTAISVGTFVFTHFIPMQQLTVVEWIDTQAMFNGVVRVAADNSKLFARHVDVEVKALQSIKRILTPLESQRLPIVCGPSGSGKTTTTLISLQNYRCIHLTQTLDDVNNEVELGRDEHVDRNRKVVTRLIEKLKAMLSKNVTKRCDDEVVLVVDELGETPNFLRALCALHKPAPAKNAKKSEKIAYDARQSEWKRLKDVLLVDTLHLVAVGTGCDRPDGTVGSTNASYEIIHMDDAWGATVRKSILDNAGLDPSLLSALQCGEDSFELDRVNRALLNPRIAALFVNEALKVHRIGCDWVRWAPHALNLVFEKFFTLNGLQNLNYRQRAFIFSCALALSLGGPAQKLDNYTFICTRYGLIADNAVRIERHFLSPSEHIELKTETDADLGATTNASTALVVPKNNPHRYVMSASTHEMILGSVFGISSHVRTGEGFEMTVVDFLLVQLLAGSTDMEIAPVPNDALNAVKTAARELAGNADVLLAMQLQQTALTPAQALEEVTSRAALFVNRTQRTSHGGNRITFAAVARNRDMAPAADAFVVRGALTQKGKADEWVPEQGEQPCAKQSPSPSVSLQFKHYTKAAAQEYMVKAEFFKMGRVTVADFAGHVASNASVADIADVDSLMAFINKQAANRNVCVSLNVSAMKKVVSLPPQKKKKSSKSPPKKKKKPAKDRVKRVQLFEALNKECSIRRMKASEVAGKVASAIWDENPSTFDEFWDVLRKKRRECRLHLHWRAEQLEALKQATFRVEDAVSFVVNCEASLDTVVDESLFIVALLPPSDTATKTFGEATFVRLHEKAQTTTVVEGELSRSLRPIAVHSTRGGGLDGLHYVSYDAETK